MPIRDKAINRLFRKGWQYNYNRGRLPIPTIDGKPDPNLLDKLPQGQCILVQYRSLDGLSMQVYSKRANGEFVHINEPDSCKGFTSHSFEDDWCLRYIVLPAELK